FTNQNGITGNWTAGTGTMALTGSATKANYQTALRSITYQNTDTDNPSTATRTVTFIVNDGDDNSNSQTRNITIAAVNDAPVLDNSATMNLTGINEDPASNNGDLVSAIIATSTANGNNAITDAESDPEGLAIIGIDETSPNGNWQYATNGSTWIDIPNSVSNTSALLLSADGNTRIRFVPAVNENGTLSPGLTVRAWDGSDSNAEGTSGINVSSNGGSTAYSSASEDVSIVVTAVNDRPVHTVPATQTTNQNVDLTFSTALPNLISIADVDAGGSSVRVTLTSTNGTATLNGVTGLTFTTGNGTADPVMVFTGALSAINTALNGLIFSPTTNFIGAASVQIQTDDQGNTGSGGAETDDDTITINVLSNPQVSVSPSPIVFGNVPTNTPLVLTITVSNPGGTTLSITNITSDNGVFVPSTTTLSVAAGGSQTFTITYTPIDGSLTNATLTITSNDPSSPTAIAMQGQGTVQVTPGNLDFGVVDFGQASVLSLTIDNQTGVPRNMLSLVFSDPQFTTITPLPLAIIHGAQGTIDIQFSPTQGGGISSTVDLTYNPTLTIELSGCGGTCSSGSGSGSDESGASNSESELEPFTVPFGGEVYLLMALVGYGIYAISRKNQDL
ncbi:MAG: choice-of-anchor D domain-containing protein, partial [Gemmatimonadetes bacterium]|nr:choice-of-anchor D domain-containing protein [Gemmatimonadota bacterium]